MIASLDGRDKLLNAQGLGATKAASLSFAIYKVQAVKQQL